MRCLYSHNYPVSSSDTALNISIGKRRLASMDRDKVSWATSAHDSIASWAMERKLELLLLVLWTDVAALRRWPSVSSSSLSSATVSTLGACTGGTDRDQWWCIQRQDVLLDVRCWTCNNQTVFGDFGDQLWRESWASCRWDLQVLGASYTLCRTCNS